MSQRLIVGISGASGVIYGVRLLECLRGLGVESHLVMTPAAEVTLGCETTRKVAAVRALASHGYSADDMAAPISSGSFQSMGMVVAPCSMKSLAEIATGATTTLLTRAADVMLKERRRLVLLVRETPLHSGHLRNMLTVSELGGIIAPPVPAFYARPESLDDMIDHTVGRILDLFGLETGKVVRWRDDSAEPAAPVRLVRGGETD
jgi:4-hydroxy-3-polyprenylbenzoate decarboxylase